jgi:hypothetical protein
MSNAIARTGTQESDPVTGKASHGLEAESVRPLFGFVCVRNLFSCSLFEPTVWFERFRCAIKVPTIELCERL